MLKWTLSLLFLLFSSLGALELSINSAQQDHNPYSILHLRHSEAFVCEEIKDDFEHVTQIICAFNKRPVQLVKEIQNNFFKIDTLVKDKTFFVLIHPMQNIKLFANLFDLTQDSSVYTPNVTKTQDWFIVGYKEKLPLIYKKEQPDNSINFPFFMDKESLPFVGGLDIKGNPIYIKKVEDVTEYLKIKKKFKEKKYDTLLESINEVLTMYPNTLFKAELLYYKIKVFAKVKDYDNVIAISKVYLRDYSADENIPEVLSLVSKAYASVGLNIDADYFFDRLFSEHENSKYTLWGYIYKGEMLESSGGTNAAINFYEKALNSAQSIDVAVAAAYRLAYINILLSHKKASKYIFDIVNAKPNYMIHNLKTSMDMMNTFVDNQNYKTAAAIAKALTDEMKRDNDEYEFLLKSRALWLAQTDEKKEALQALNKYIKEFPDGDFISEIDVAKDGLFFDTNDENTTQKLIEYTNLMNTYENDVIGNRATYEKAKLLLSLQKYSEVLEMKQALEALDGTKYSDIAELIEDAAVGLMQDSLKNKKCHDVLQISNKYKISLSDEWDDGLYECAMKGSDFSLAKKMANKHFKSKDLDERKKWLYRYINVDFETGNYSDVLQASNDLVALIEDDKKSQYSDVYRYLFDTYERLEQNENMLKSIINIEKIFGINYIDLDRYVNVMNVGNDLKDNNIVVKYGKIAYDIQKKSKAYPQSPGLEFALYQAYMRKEEYNKALEIIKSLNTLQMSKAHTARQKYLLGSVYSKLWRDDEAIAAYKMSIKADETSAWAKLAKSALEI